MKTFLRFLSHHRLFAAIEVLGISIALAFIIPLLSYVGDLWRVDHDNRDYADIYTFTLGNMAGTFDEPAFLRDNFPEVEQTTLFSATRPADIKVGTESYGIELLLADTDFFDFFPTRFLAGSPELLADRSAAFVSERFSEKIGYGRDAVGKTFNLDGLDYTIAGIVADYAKSLMPYHDVFISIYAPTLQFYWDHPTRLHYKDLTFFRLRKGTDRETFLGKLRDIGHAHYGPALGWSYDEEGAGERGDYIHLVRYDEVSTSPHNLILNHSNRTGFYLALILSAILLLFALFNYINLNIALATRRAKEMATRRILGSTRGDIIRKLLGESLLMTAVCFGLGLALSYAVVPQINRMFQASGLGGFALSIEPTWLNISMSVVLILGVASFAGIIPALYIARYQALDVIKGSFRASSKMVFSKVLIFLQCFLTLVLLVASIVYVSQYRKILSRPLGADVDNTFWFYGPYAHHELDPVLPALRQLACVDEAGYTDDRPGQIFQPVFLLGEGGTETIRGRDRDGEETTYTGFRFYPLICSEEAFRAFGFAVLRDLGAHGERVLWLTETAARDLGVDPADPVLDPAYLAGFDADALGGIVGDFLADYLNDDTPVIRVQADWYQSPTAYYKSIAVKVNGDRREARKAILETVRKTLDKTSIVYKEPHLKGYVPELNRQNLDSQRTMVVFIAMFAVLMLVLSVLGLIGMSTYYVSTRERDIAIRKVFGATSEDETWRSIRGYLYIVAAACLAGIPVAFYAATELLKNFVHKIAQAPWIFLAATAFILGLSALSVLWQTVKVTRMNPSGVLKKE